MPLEPSPHQGAQSKGSGPGFNRRTPRNSFDSCEGIVMTTSPLLYAWRTRRDARPLALPVRPVAVVRAARFGTPLRRRRWLRRWRGSLSATPVPRLHTFEGATHAATARRRAGEKMPPRTGWCCYLSGVGAHTVRYLLLW